VYLFGGQRLAAFQFEKGSSLGVRPAHDRHRAGSSARREYASTANSCSVREPGSPWENGYIESFNGKLRNELLDREVFYTLLEVSVLTERYRRTYNRVQTAQLAGLPAAGA